MKQMLMLLLFLTGVAPLVRHKYYLIQQNKTWSDAQTYCRAHHVDLATIHSAADMVRLQAEAQMHQFTSDAWFGVYKQLHGWGWSYRNESLGNETYWSLGEPSSISIEEECGLIHSDGHWTDATCNWPIPSVCYDERNTGTSRYVYIKNTKNWYEALSYCRLYHTDLASVRDPTEQSIVTGMVPRLAWFGLSRVTWKWLDQTNPTSITWKSGQPDNDLRKKNCGYLSNFTAADALCSDLKPFFCYRVITGQIQIVRLRVQSDQNMNDPARKAALLEKILQKLKEHGMKQNIKLKWREGPGGEVFHKINDYATEYDTCQRKLF